MILHVQVPDLKTYRDNPEQILRRSHACPACGHQPLGRHDTRWRWIYTATEHVRLRIFRLHCSACGIVVTLLPDFLVPHFRYVAHVIQDAITAYLSTTASYRGLAIQIAGGVTAGMGSITDALLTIRLRPSYQRIHAWVNHLAELATSFTQSLTTWLLRLRPNSHLLHLLATPILAFDTKSASEEKRLKLRAAALLHAIVHQTPELAGPRRGAWLARLSTLYRHIREGLDPTWQPRARADPPST